MAAADTGGLLVASVAAFGAGGAALVRSFTVDRRSARRDDVEALWEENRLLRQENEGIRAMNRQLNDQLFRLQAELAQEQRSLVDLKAKLREQGADT